MWWALDERILKTATRLICEHETYARAVHDENERRKRRSTRAPSLLPLRRPETWQLDAGFDPFHVRSNRSAIAHAITNRLKDRTYEPRRPAGFLVPKSSGGQRTVSTFQIADEVVSNRLLRNLTRKNLPRFSARAYAYRPDLGPHDAISYVRAEFSREHRLFVAEYDFSKFFDTVDHDFLRQALDDVAVNRTPLEEYIIDRFLEAPEPYLDSLEKAARAPKRVRGVPQGTSLSLFLANLAASGLDRALERLGVGFVRYADDTLIWSTDYSRICDAAAALHEASQQIGSPINAEKSLGIRLLTRQETVHAEMVSTKSVDFLGHTLGLRSTTIKAASMRRIRSRVDQLVYNNLLMEPLAGTQNMLRFTDVDKDYVTLIWQLRRYLYGPLTESDVRRFSKGSIPPMSFEGVMAYFPLIDDDQTLRELDNWISTRIWLALRKRSKLLTHLATAALPPPHGVDKVKLLALKVKSGRTGDDIDLRIPSVRMIASVLRLAVSTYGLGVVSGRAPLYLYDAVE